MAKVNIKRVEIEKMMKDQLKINSISWGKNGNATVEMDFEDLKPKEKIVEKETIRTIPVYSQPYYRWYPWTVICKSNATSTPGYSLVYSVPTK
jgi:hypothetical protein